MYSYMKANSYRGTNLPGSSSGASAGGRKRRGSGHRRHSEKIGRRRHVHGIAGIGSLFCRPRGHLALHLPRRYFCALQNSEAREARLPLRLDTTWTSYSSPEFATALMMRCFKMPGTKCVEFFKTVTAPPSWYPHPLRKLLLIAAATCLLSKFPEGAVRRASTIGLNRRLVPPAAARVLLPSREIAYPQPL